jgi:hypothetical protein
MIFREFEEESDSDDDDEKQPKKIKYSKILKEDEFIEDDDDAPFLVDS